MVNSLIQIDAIWRRRIYPLNPAERLLASLPLPPFRPRSAFWRPELRRALFASMRSFACLNAKMHLATSNHNLATSIAIDVSYLVIGFRLGIPFPYMESPGNSRWRVRVLSDMYTTQRIPWIRRVVYILHRKICRIWRCQIGILTMPFHWHANGTLDYQPLVSYGDLPGTSGVIQDQSQYTTFLHCATTTAACNNVAGRNPLYSAGEYAPTQRWGLKS